MSRLWHPFADMATVKDGEFVVVRGEGARVWDEQGREYVDAKGGLWYCAVGHGRGEIADAAALERLFEQSGGTIAAFIGEPVIGAGGIFHPAPGYWQRVQELCATHEVLLIADEVICGFGRLGTWFGCHRFGITPDIITCAKGITSGYLPLGAVVVAPRVQEPFWSTPAQAMFRHGSTYSGHPSVCPAALANLDILEREGRLERVARLEPVPGDAIRPVSDRPLV